MNPSSRYTYLFTGALLFLIASFPFCGSFIIGWFCLIPLIRVIDTSRNLRGSFLYGLTGGFIIALVSLSWLIYVTVLGWILLSLYIGLYTGVFGLIRFYRKGIVYSSIIWCLLEYIRSNMASGFPWLLAGATQVRFLPLLQVSVWTGVYGVSFIAVLYNLLLYEGIFNKSKRAFLTFCGILVGVIILGGLVLNEVKPRGRYLNVGLVQPNIPQYIKLDYRTLPSQMKVIEALSHKIGPTDLLVYPETVVPGVLRGNSYSFFCKLARDKHTWIILGSWCKEKAGDRYKYYNSAFLISPDGRLMGEYRKIHLVPFGEYIPFRDKIPFLRILVPIGEGFSKGPQYTVFDAGGRKISTVICFEDIFPALVRRFVKNGATLLINITNDAWFGRSAGPYQHLALSVFRAVENRRWLVRCTNTGVSAYIEPSGRIRWVKPFEEQAVVGKVFLDNKPTFYTTYGDLPFLTFLIVILILHYLPFRILDRVFQFKPWV